MESHDITDIIKKSEKLIKENDEIYNKLHEALEVIKAVKKGKMDGVSTGSNGTSNVLLSKTADEAYKKLIENMAEGVVMLRTDGIILYCNSSFARMFNMPLEKMIGTDFHGYIPAESLPDLKLFVENSSGKNSKFGLSLLNTDSIRNHFVICFNKVHIHDSLALNMVWTDVTGHKSTEEKFGNINKILEKAIGDGLQLEHKVALLNVRLNENTEIMARVSNELSKFAELVSDDFQEQLEEITNYSNKLIRNYTASIDDHGQGYLHNIKSAAERMQGLINEFLANAQRSH